MPTRKKTAKARQTDENRRERFVRIGDNRMNRVLNSIRLLGNLANSNYECRATDVRTMVDAIQYAVGQMEAKFAKHGRAEPLTFHFEAAANSEEATAH